MNMPEENVVETLSQEEVWAFLGSQQLARLAFAIAGEPEIVPINYVVSDERIYFRTAEGSKLLGLTINARVALETDRVGDGVATSVIVHGTARELQTIDELEWAEALPLRTWVPTRKVHFVEITPDELTGRRFHLGDGAPDA
ncbi:nitroimidazol reductase NimA-like FMN-containing flavoprotein (pyridoxamine 5'-phosphate oxidase superfamily) [Kineosphaera limosa]|uniref:Pyridoxamine 5'-phosphate oxidase putative domain-containing protein n=1 Tax=Kineosphaera limosa NBRC 100340 TaxID=1184609 RepID=K6WVV1_9MICO|nr:pyridoxamine 5'-phosphate oxidase family protein [Kineosphaera limosa]NYE02625.1 nitroimidazol reductase NimA-like FMN-containing flavoprotein (pyridoxamine 5'-phosphate oxidase superfamily) [Kineosphaera limosa]GAB97951.1 hypothetical protein KILIM_090_00040 [Kineosphaera limosa NBRC 100340]